MKTVMLALSVLSSVVAANVMAQDLIIYPSNNQSAEQQSSDEGECFVWARDNSGVDPLNLTANIPQATDSSPRRGGAVRGAMRGAVIGGIVGDSDDARDAAKVGAAVGISRQRRQNQAAASQQQQQQTQAIAEVDSQMASFNSYYATCLEGKGYAVN